MGWKPRGRLSVWFGSGGADFSIGSPCVVLRAGARTMGLSYSSCILTSSLTHEKSKLGVEIKEGMLNSIPMPALPLKEEGVTGNQE